MFGSEKYRLWLKHPGINGKDDPPPPPDYAAAAQAQGAANVDAAIATGLLSNPEFINAYGSRSIEFDPNRNYTTGIGADQRTVPGIKITDALSPVEQTKLERNNALELGLLNTAQTGLSNVDRILSTEFNPSGLPQITTPTGPEGLSQVSDALLARLEPQFERQRQQLETQLVNQGFARGSEGFAQGMDQHNRGLNDARLAALAQAQNAAQSSYGMQSDQRARALQEALSLRQLPLNEVNALRTGNQVNLPQFQSYQGQNVAAAPIYQAANDQYQADLGAHNAQAASSGNFTKGLFSLGSAALMSPWLMASDRRLKSNIRRIGEHSSGIGIYTYIKNGKPEVGVMADEVETVLPQAVVTMPDGFKAVNYSML